MKNSGEGLRKLRYPYRLRGGNGIGYGIHFFRLLYFYPQSKLDYQYMYVIVTADELVLLHVLASRQHNGDDSP